MKPLRVDDGIVPIGEFKTHASRILRDLKQTGRPVVITQNGRPAGVLVSPAEFDRLTERERFIAAIEEGLADAEAGRVYTTDEVKAHLARRFGTDGEEQGA